MKTLISIAFSLLVTTQLSAQCINVGNDVDLGQNSSHSPNYLLGTAHTLTFTDTLTSFGVLSRNSVPNIIVAVYTDNGGQPDQLVAQSVSTSLVTGINSIDVPDTVLTPGDYWLMGIYNVTGSIGFTTATSATVHYISLGFGSPLPNPFPAPSTYTGQDFNYWMEFCGSGCLSPSMTTFSAGADTLCQGDSTTLTVSGNLNGAQNWYLYEGGCGATPVDSSVTGIFSVTPTATTTYYVRGRGWVCHTRNLF